MVRQVVVLGAGIVGVSVALELLDRGFEVTLMDRKFPGEETSYGNAGVWTRSSLVPINNPTLWKNLPKFVSNRTTALRYYLPFLMRNLNWTFRFLMNARHSKVLETAAALDQLISLSMQEHMRLVAAAGEEKRLSEKGWMFLYRNPAGFEASRLTRDIFDRFDLDTEILDADQISDLEPSLNRIFSAATWIKDAKSIDNPGALVAAYAKLFVAKGGKFVQKSAQSLSQSGSGWNVTTQDGDNVVCDDLVVALGPWSPGLLKTVSINVPMGYERGYHMHFRSANGGHLNRPICDASGGYVLAPMEQGYRLTTGVELDACDAPEKINQFEQAVSSAKEAFPLTGPVENSPWMGRRPTLPDSRPIIGAVPKRKGLWLAFGHQHIGFCTGPGTARVLADLMTGQSPPIDAKPFCAERYLA